MTTDSRSTRPDAGAVTAAMALVPGLYSRNRMFAFFTDPEMRTARVRARTLRHLARELAAPSVEIEVEPAADGYVVRYRVPEMRLSRRLELTRLEGACVAYLLARAGHPTSLGGAEHDRGLLEAALLRLSTDLRLGEIERNVAR